MKSTRPNPAFLLLQTATGEALECLARQQLDDETVHTARKALKKARAALRLLRPVLEDEEYRADNLALRNAGRFLSPLRDARVLLGAIDSLAESDVVGGVHAAAIVELRKLMQARLSQAHDAVAQPDARRRCSNLIEATRERLGRQLLTDANTEALHSGLIRIYRRARKAFMQTLAENTTETLHEWRKQTKYLRSAAAALRGSENHELHKAEKSADEISDWLGDDHDLAVLCGLVHEHVSPEVASELIRLIEARRTKLQRKAFTEAKELFAKKPKQFLADVR